MQIVPVSDLGTKMNNPAASGRGINGWKNTIFIYAASCGELTSQRLKNGSIFEFVSKTDETSPPPSLLFE